MKEIDKVISVAEELEMCKSNPYYFAKKYMKINGNPFETMISEDDFNLYFRQYEKLPKHQDFIKKRLSEAIMNF
jgi:hypothetical protein